MAARCRSALPMGAHRRGPGASKGHLTLALSAFLNGDSVPGTVQQQACVAHAPWPLAGGLLAWLAGALWQMHEAALRPGALEISLAVVALAVAAGVGGWLTQRRCWSDGPALGWRMWQALCLALAMGAAAYASTHAQAAHRLAQRLPAAIEGVEMWVRAEVLTLPSVGASGARFTVRVLGWQPGVSEPWQSWPAHWPQQLSMAWFDAVGDSAQDEPAVAATAPPSGWRQLRAGQVWLLPVRLRQPHGAFNPHGFDLELWLFERGLRATGVVSASAAHAAAARWVATRAAPLQDWRQRVRERLQQHLGDTPIAGVLTALAVGDQAAIERADWVVFRTTGVAHLMSISGLHITVFAWAAAWVVGHMWRCSARANVLLAAPHASRWGGLLLATVYALASGWGVPAQRTVLMLAVVVLWRSVGLRWPATACLMVAAWGVAVLDPWALLQPSFWLSFVAVAVLVVLDKQHVAGDALALDTPPSDLSSAQRRSRWAWTGQRLRAAVHQQWVASWALAPLGLAFFHQVSIVGLLANVVAIPLVTWWVMPLALLGSLWSPLWDAAAVGMRVLMLGLEGLAAWPGAAQSWPAAWPWAATCGVLGAVLAVGARSHRWRVCGGLLVLPLLAPAAWQAWPPSPGIGTSVFNSWMPHPRPQPGQFELLAVDIGQGTAVLLRTHRHTLLVDTGPPGQGGADAGERILVPLLRAIGVGPLDALLLSHADADHVGGAASVLAQVGTRLLLSPLPTNHPLRGAWPHRACQAGQRWQWDGVQFQVLHPAPGALLPNAAPASANALSCVLHVQAAHENGRTGRSALLAADIEAAQELALLHGSASGQRPHPLHSEVLLVPHHGSRTSSTPAFVQAVSPRYAVVQAAYRSRYGHPAADVQARWEAHGATVVRSDRCGAFTWHSDGRAPRCERQARQRYWHHPGAPSLSAALPPAPEPAR